MHVQVLPHRREWTGDCHDMEFVACVFFNKSSSLMVPFNSWTYIGTYLGTRVPGRYLSIYSQSRWRQVINVAFPPQSGWMCGAKHVMASAPCGGSRACPLLYCPIINISIHRHSYSHSLFSTLALCPSYSRERPSESTSDHTRQLLSCLTSLPQCQWPSLYFNQHPATSKLSSPQNTIANRWRVTSSYI